ncbi:MAG: hypothetical protein IJS17_00090 [Clostridia bacterium]|nr:hypothetical protein [Clostridia bacterium]
MTALYVITKYLTFPGAFLRCFWEQFMCKLFKLPIENNKCLQTNEMCGHIEHEMVDGKVKSFFFTFVPGFLTFLMGVVCLIPPVVDLLILNVSTTLLRIVCFVLLYFAVSMLTNIFPGIEDAMVMWENYTELGIGLKILFFLGAATMKIGAYCEKYTITFWTNFAIAALILFL